MSGKSKIETTAFDKSFRKLNEAVLKASEKAVAVTMSRVTPFTMSFDAVESLSLAQGRVGTLVLSGPALSKASGEVEGFLAVQTQEATEILQEAMNTSLKETIK